MALKTYGQLLEEVQTAIDAVQCGAQEYEINGRKVRYTDMQWLLDRERMLIKKVDQFGYNAFPGSMSTSGRAGVRFV